MLHHALMNVCHSAFERHFIYTTYATRPGKGVYAALDRAFYAINNYNYVGKFDVRHYFDTIDHQILKNKLSRLFKDKVLLKIFFKIIDSYKVIEGKGLPIGNLTSQYFANYYLSFFDHWCKEILKSKEYIRYMDDFLLFSNDRDMLEQSVVKVNDYMKTNLLLDLKIAVLSNNKLGVSFLGYNLSKHKILLNSRSKKQLRNKMNIYAHLLNTEWTEQQYMKHITPLLAFSRYGYTKQLRYDIITARNI